MKISVIVPSFQQRQYLEECFESLADNDGIDLELIVVDGGSTDGSVELIRKYENRIAWWVSERDEGQADAINKGLRRATGDVWSYLNSDDVLKNGACSRSRVSLRITLAQWLSGRCRVFGKGIETWFLQPVTGAE